MELRLFGPAYEDVAECLREPIKKGLVDRLWYSMPEIRVVSSNETVEAVLQKRFGAALFTREGKAFSAVVGELFKQRNLTLATAESCTGGLIGDMITNVPGSSAYYLLGVISYSNRAKERVLGVNDETLRRHGAVSAPVVEEMLKGVLNLSGADCGLAVSGIAGPDGGTKDKPVGTVYISVGCRDARLTRRFHFDADRHGNKLWFKFFKYF